MRKGFIFSFHEERTTLPWKALLHKVLKIFHRRHRIRCLCKNLLRGIVPVERDSSKLWSVAPEVLLLMAVAPAVAVAVSLPRAVAGLLAVAAALGVPLVAVALSKKTLMNTNDAAVYKVSDFSPCFRSSGRRRIRLHVHPIPGSCRNPGCRSRPGCPSPGSCGPGCRSPGSCVLGFRNPGCRSPAGKTL